MIVPIFRKSLLHYSFKDFPEISSVLALENANEHRAMLYNFVSWMMSITLF